MFGDYLTIWLLPYRNERQAFNVKKTNRFVQKRRLYYGSPSASLKSAFFTVYRSTRGNRNNWCLDVLNCPSCFGLMRSSPDPSTGDNRTSATTAVSFLPSSSEGSLLFFSFPKDFLGCAKSMAHKTLESIVFGETSTYATVGC